LSFVYVTDVQVQDSGTYTCKAVSETGETTWTAYLVVNSKFSCSE